MKDEYSGASQKHLNKTNPQNAFLVALSLVCLRENSQETSDVALLWDAKGEIM